MSGGGGETPHLPLWHLAHEADWRDALVAGRYTMSTRGVTLEQEGFIHCSYPHQLAAVARTFYADDPEPLLVLDIDRGVLAAHGVRVVTEDVGDGQRYPHLYGPIPVEAVTAVRPAEVAADGSFFLGDPESPALLDLRAPRPPSPDAEG